MFCNCNNYRLCPLFSQAYGPHWCGTHGPVRGMFPPTFGNSPLAIYLYVSYMRSSVLNFLICCQEYNLETSDDKGKNKDFHYLVINILIIFAKIA